MNKISTLLVTLLFILFALTVKCQELIAPNNGSVFGEIEATTSYVYRGGLNAQVVRYDLNDPNFQEESVASGAGSNFLRFDLDAVNNQVYLAQFDGPITTATIVEGSTTTLSNIGTFELETLGLQYDNGWVYAMTTAPQIFRFMPNDPDNTAALILDPASPLPFFNIHIKDGFLYYSTQSSFTAPVEYQLFRLDLSEGTPQPELVTTTSNRIWSITSIGDFLYLLNDETGTVYKTSITNPDTQAAVFTTLTTAGNQEVFSIAHNGSHLFYVVNGTNGGVFRIADEVLNLEAFNKNSLSIYPNPTSDILYINNPTENNTSYTIVNALGQMISQGKVSSNQSIGTSSLKKGIYILQIVNGESGRFIKM